MRQESAGRKRQTFNCTLYKWGKYVSRNFDLLLLFVFVLCEDKENAMENKVPFQRETGIVQRFRSVLD
jgi:hypothetical protein